ncbi:class I SAM-dependent methyltransferase [Thiomicrorhabdus lithotrophica]|uniref:Class I SAM-dependent methyltransferase n=1 Tax=Thiomicrorhabdus lithotrophica TaxID=2949997 RepID=A0ABY8C7X2_9GAMM|nr:class I SAM-dependent methyltransferase [Thiomicrorhabdus lithotrophica]WEJ62066.1 class I SAM-dependent methyltransferase [Thiomicrorhabdus lithotrophica]
MEKTQAQILRHHGGDANHARKMITQSYERRHDIEFWEFWNAQMGVVIAKGDSLLDLGAGIGQFIEDLAIRYPDNTAIGIDAAEYMLAAQVSLPNNARMLKDDLNEPVANIGVGKVATVMANMLVHELPQPVNMFKSVYKWLKPGGRFCIIDLVRQPLEDYLTHKYPNAELWNNEIERDRIEDVFEHFLEHNRYHADDILFMLKSLGFKIIENTPQRDGRFVRIVVEKPA